MYICSIHIHATKRTFLIISGIVSHNLDLKSIGTDEVLICTALAAVFGAVICAEVCCTTI